MMGRLRTPPPTDDQARAIIAGVGEIDASSVSNFDFLLAFIRVVHDACGSLYGAKRYRELLRAYAPHRSPSTTTIQAAIDAVRARSLPANEAASPDVPRRPPVRDRGMPAAPHGAADSSGLRVLEFELAHYRARSKELEKRCDSLMHERQAEREELARLAGQRDAATEVAEQMESRVAELAAAVAAAERLAAGSQRFAMEQIEAARAETRLLRAQLDQANNELGKERESVAAYRRRLNDGVRAQR